MRMESDRVSAPAADGAATKEGLWARGVSVYAQSVERKSPTSAGSNVRH